MILLPGVNAVFLFIYLFIGENLALVCYANIMVYIASTVMKGFKMRKKA